MVQSPMLSCPLKQTAEIDWVTPLKDYIRTAYGDDPERYHEECTTLHKLRQDMRGAGCDSASGRDLLYRYYGQLELLDLRFPVDENHIKISFTWYDAFTSKATSQYSLAYEKASVLFNISAVLCCHAAAQNRAEDTGIKAAYHSFQASAGMFTYINENFLHAPSTDLSRDTVKTLINITLAQAQEVFLEKQVADQKKPAFLAKLASQAAYLYAQAAETVQDYVSKAIFEKPWLSVVQAKASHFSAVASYFQAIADMEANSHGTAIARLQLSDKMSAAALTWAKSLPSTVPASANAPPDTAAVLTEIFRRQQTRTKETLASAIKDNDFIYHQPVPNEAGLSPVSRLPAAKAIPVSELYQGQDIQRITGPDIFQKLVPMAVTESASRYDEEKAQLIRAETERVETADGEMAASLDYLKLPGSLQVLKGGLDQNAVTVDEEFRRWCSEMAAHGAGFHKTLDELQESRATILELLTRCTRQLDLEESVCEKMRTKYGADWTQQPSSRLTASLRSDIRRLRETINEASASDAQLKSTLKHYEADFDEMFSAGETDEADVLFQRAMIKAGSKHKADRNGRASPYGTQEGSLLDEVEDEGRRSVAEQIARVEELLKKLNLVKRERGQVLKDLKEKVHEDDISNVLILNRKALGNGREQQLFQAELEKFRPYQNRIIKANHTQASLMKELTKVYGDLLQDKRVRSEQSKYEAITRQRNSVMSRYRKVYNAFRDLVAGIAEAKKFYSEMQTSVNNLWENVDSFVNNRRAEGAQLLSHIEREKATGGTTSSSNSTSNSTAQQEERDREQLREMMERLSTGPSSPSSRSRQANNTTTNSKPPGSSSSSSGNKSPHHQHRPSSSTTTTATTATTTATAPAPTTQHSPATYAAQYMAPSLSSYYYGQPTTGGFQQGAATPLSEGYNPMAYPYQSPLSPPQPSPATPYYTAGASAYPPPPPPPPPPATHHPTAAYMTPGYIPPPPHPPPPGSNAAPRPGQPAAAAYPGAYAAPQYHHQRTASSTSASGSAATTATTAAAAPGQSDPWAGLNAWK
ncbi:hypothetical protein VTN49DRAFT_4301 [Thermomyces lanuginosus]|uniref:uncharacterized protein n=1 Tax=Thermomyces lanuginosus TaxID=5541 RepID=UPI003742DA79